MKEREFWRNRQTGRVYAIECDDGVVSGACGPLALSEVEERFLAAFDYAREEAAWFEAHRDEFDLYSLLGPPSPRPAGVEEALERTTVAEAMHPGVIVCPPRASLRDVARIMASARIHAVVVLGDEEDDSEGVWGIVSDLDLVAAAARGDLLARTAVGAAGTRAVSVRDDETLEAASRLMERHGVGHLVVTSDGLERPVGILSTLDIARALSGRS
jgi:CBS domain-containing protein